MKNHSNYYAAFTLFEVLIVASLLTMLLGTIYTGYQFCIGSFKTTAWKQERIQQTQLFWQILRKHIEEAADEHDMSTGDMIVTPQPLQFRSVPPGLSSAEQDGDLLKWIRFRLSSGGICEYKLNCLLSLRDKKVYLEVKPLTSDFPQGEIVTPAKKLLDDVGGFVVKTTRIRQSPSRGDYLDDGNPSLDPVIGSIVEISVIFVASSSISGKQQEMTQNYKVKIAVDFIQKTDKTFL